MNTQDLIAGYAAYTDAAELGVVSADEAPAVTPTTASSAVCVASISVTVDKTIDNGC